MKLSEFDYNLPRELIAQHPLEKRSSSRLLVLDRDKKEIQHRRFTDIIHYLRKSDVLVFNDTQVKSARLIGKKITGGKVEALLLEKKSDRHFLVLLKPELKLGEEIIFDGGALQATVVDKGILCFNTSDSDYIYSKGITPLPPYIKRMPQPQDIYRYQTVYARNPGAVASPTAGLHFDEEVLNQLKEKGIEIVFVTLHINYATFKPVRENDITLHRMYKEYYRVSSQDLDLLNNAKLSGNRIICVGTTSVRVLETITYLSLDDRKRDTYYDGYTDLFIYPGYEFKMTQCLLTNFHLPRTTLLMLVCALAGRDCIMQAYNEAIRQRYRFLSYGDAMLVV